jgi:hypothetical protein
MMPFPGFQIFLQANAAAGALLKISIKGDSCGQF